MYTSTDNKVYQTGPTLPGSHNIKFGDETGLEVDFSSLSAVTINALRQTALYQQILELDARGGTRYVESIYSRFGVVSPDFRLQRPELIGQGSTRINVYAVPQTAPTTDDSPQGNLAAFGVSQIQGDHGCRYSATEHGLILGLLNVRADLTYQQGLPRMYSRRTRLDFYEPLLNGLGEQAVLQKKSTRKALQYPTISSSDTKNDLPNTDLKTRKSPANSAAKHHSQWTSGTRHSSFHAARAKLCIHHGKCSDGPNPCGHK